MASKGTVAAGIVILLVGIGTAFYSGAAGAVLGAIGLIVTGVGAAIKRKKLEV